MIDFLAKRFIKSYKDTKTAVVREQYGKLSSIVGIIINLSLFAAKFTVGTLANSISITGDAVNNLSDTGSSVVSLVSFKLSGKPADDKHPFGHARIEYIASSIVAVVILLIGVELAKSSVDKIFHPVNVEFNFVTILILIMSIAAKLWLFSFYKKTGRRIDSSVMQAAAADSMSDVLATSTVLISLLLSPLIHFQLDGYMGVAVSVFIMISGINILKDTMDRILGQGPSEELARLIEGYIRKHEGIIGIHDLIVHDYGPQRSFASVHAEVDARVDILDSHDLIDNIERDIVMEHGINLVIHLDPVVRDDPYANELQQKTEQVVDIIDESLSVHDFRVVRGQTHSNLIFDVKVSNGCKMSDKSILIKIQQGLAVIDKSLHAVVTFDRSYISSSGRPR